MRREDPETHKGKGHVKDEAKVGVMQLQRKEHHGELGAGRGKEDPSPGALRGSRAPPTP